MGFWPVVKNLLRQADIIVLVADARMPDMSMNRELVEKIAYMQKLHVIVFTKIDLISQAALAELRARFPESLFVSGIKNIGVSGLKKHLLILARRNKIDEPKIGVVGYPNIGKSALINALAHRARAPISSTPGTTKGLQWIKAGGLSVIDSPGVVPFEDKNSKLAILGAKSPEKMSAPEKAAKDVIGLFIIKNPQGLKKRYGIELDTNNVDVLLENIGKKKGHLLKGGIVDEHRTSLMILRDWQKGTLGFK